MKIFMTFLALNLLIGGNFKVPNESKSIATLIKDNISEFNSAQRSRGKQETNFNSVTKILEVKNEVSKSIGELIIFDDNKGYLFVGEGNYIRDHNYNHGFDQNIIDLNMDYLIFDGNNYYDDKLNLLHTRVKNLAGSGTRELFHWHADNAFMTEKDRELLTELSPQYDTLAKVTSSSFFGNKIMWSHEQDGNDCAQLAISNLLWTYKMNNVISLPSYCNTYTYLLQEVYNYVPLDVGPGNATSTISITDINNMFDNNVYSCNYRIDYAIVSDGISDELEYGPVIGFYTDNIINEGHFALVTGKGRSVYKKILGIPLYTSWDIVNTWYEYGELDEGYLRHKYWIDNQYIFNAWELEYRSTLNMIPLING